MEYDYGTIIADFREKWTRLAEEADPISAERHAYQEAIQCIDNERAESPKQRAFEIAISLMDFTRATPKPEVRRVLRQCTRDFNHETGQDMLRF
jgi:hypothetical protein